MREIQGTARSDEKHFGVGVSRWSPMR
jgi:hypothetical protein